MEINEYLDLFNDTEELISIFEITLEFFSTELSEELLKENDFEIIVLDIFDEFNSLKYFDRLVEFIHLIKNKQPNFYFNVFAYFDQFLIEYYSFKQNNEQVKNSYSIFLKHPDNDIEYFNNVLRIFIFYQNADLLNELQNIDYNSFFLKEELLNVAYFDLSNYISMNNIEANYLNGKTNDEYSAINDLIENKFKINHNYISQLDLLNNNVDLELIISKFSIDKKEFLINLNGLFLKYMLSKGIKFYLSNYMWQLLVFYLYDIHNTAINSDMFFKLNKKTFYTHILKNRSTYTDDLSNTTFTLIWGSVFIFDFLYFNKLISQNIYTHNLKIIQYLKGIFISNYISSLWKYNYIHTWQKPDGVSETEFLEEEKIFKKSFTLGNFKFENLKVEIADELSKIGELGKIISKNEAFEVKQTTNLMSDIINVLESKKKTAEIKKKKNKQALNIAQKKPVVKVGRNEPCPCGSGKKYKKCCGK